jgi:hypothetical protein
MDISHAIRKLAEEPDDQQPEPWLPAKRIIRPNFTLILGPAGDARVSCIRATAETLDQTIGEIRAILAANRASVCGWFIGSLSEPTNVIERLTERGFVPPDGPPFLPEFTAMALTRPPSLPSPQAGVEGRRVRSYEEYVRAFRAGLRAYGETEGMIEKRIDASRDGWEHANGVAKMTHVGLVDGNVAGVGMASYGPNALLLSGAAVLPEYRARGVYGALIAARWRLAVELGKPALVVQASPMSQPILKRCGFTEISRITVLLDSFLARHSR